MVIMGVNLKFQDAQGRRHVMTANNLFSTEQYDSLVIEDIQEIDSLIVTFNKWSCLHSTHQDTGNTHSLL